MLHKTRHFSAKCKICNRAPPLYIPSAIYKTGRDVAGSGSDCYQCPPITAHLSRVNFSPVASAQDVCPASHGGTTMVGTEGRIAFCTWEDKCRIAMKLALACTCVFELGISITRTDVHDDHLCTVLRNMLALYKSTWNWKNIRIIAPSVDIRCMDGHPISLSWKDPHSLNHAITPHTEMLEKPSGEKDTSTLRSKQSSLSFPSRTRSATGQIFSNKAQQCSQKSVYNALLLQCETKNWFYFYDQLLKHAMYFLKNALRHSIKLS